MRDTRIHTHQRGVQRKTDRMEDTHRMGRTDIDCCGGGTSMTSMTMVMVIDIVIDAYRAMHRSSSCRKRWGYKRTGRPRMCR